VIFDDRNQPKWIHPGRTTIAMSLLVVAILGIAAVIVMMISGNDFNRGKNVLFL